MNNLTFKEVLELIMCYSTISDFYHKNDFLHYEPHFESHLDFATFMGLGTCLTIEEVIDKETAYKIKYFPQHKLKIKINAINNPIYGISFLDDDWYNICEQIN